MILPFPQYFSLKNLCSNSNNGRDTSGVKQNLNTFQLCYIKEGYNAPYHMDLVLYFSCFRLLLYERAYFLKFLLASCLETGRVVEDKLWVAIE